MTTTTATALRDGTWTISGAPVGTFRVRTFGVLTVRGTLAVEGGTVTVAGGVPVTAEGTLDATSIATGVPKRDEHLRTARFLDAGAHPRIGLRALRFDPTGDGWIVPALLTVGGADAPLTLRAQRLADPAPGAVLVRITGEFDRTLTRIRAPRFMIGHSITVGAEVSLTRR